MLPELRLLYGRKVRLLYGLGLKIEPRVHGSKKRAGRTQARVPVRPSVLIIRSYQGESTGSHPNSEVKHPWACSVLRWGTTWESQVTYVFVFAACGFDSCWSFGFESHSYFDCTFVYLRARLIPIVNIISVLDPPHARARNFTQKQRWPVVFASEEAGDRSGEAPATTPTPATPSRCS